MTTLTEIVAGIKGRLEQTGGSLNVFDYPPAAPPTPCAFIMPPVIDYRLTMRAGVMQLDFEIVVMVGTSAGHEQQKQLFDYLDWSGTASVFVALGADPTLGLANVDAKVVGPTRPLGLEEIGGYEAFGVTIPLRVAFTNTP